MKARQKSAKEFSTQIIPQTETILLGSNRGVYKGCLCAVPTQCCSEQEECILYIMWLKTEKDLQE